MSKIIKIVLFLVVVAALVVGGVKAVKNAKAKDAAKPVAKVYPIVVPTMVPKRADVMLTLPYLAEVANDKDVKLSSRIIARIQSIKPSGSHVKKGDIVVKLDTTSIQSSLKSVQDQINAATVALQNLEATHERTLELLKVQGASIEESQKETTLIANAQANLNALYQKEIELKNNLSYATIISPVDGVITKTFANKGALSAPGHTLVSIASKNGFYLMVRVPTDLSVRGVKLDKEIYSATPLESTFNGLAEYKVYVQGIKLISGDKVEVDVVTYKQKGILLPFDAVLNRDGKSYVLEVNKNQANAVAVHILQSAQQGLVVAENLEGKKLVIAKPDILLKLLSGHTLSVKE